MFVVILFGMMAAWYLVPKFLETPAYKVVEKDRNIEVRYDDVNGAIRRLKKVLERMDFQKELSKREHYEKPSVKRKRMKDQAKKRSKKEQDNMIAKGEYMPTPVSGQKYLKGKREKRKAWVAKERIRRLRDRGH